MGWGLGWGGQGVPERWQFQMPVYQLVEILAENSKLDDNFHFSTQVEANGNLCPLPSRCRIVRRLPEVGAWPHRDTWSSAGRNDSR